MLGVLLFTHLGCTSMQWFVEIAKASGSMFVASVLYHTAPSLATASVCLSSLILSLKKPMTTIFFKLQVVVYP